MKSTKYEDGHMRRMTVAWYAACTENKMSAYKMVVEKGLDNLL